MSTEVVSICIYLPDFQALSANLKRPEVCNAIRATFEYDVELTFVAPLQQISASEAIIKLMKVTLCYLLFYYTSNFSVENTQPKQFE